MALLTDAIKKWLSVINNAIYYLVIVLSTSSLLFSLYLIFQINYCLSDYPFQNEDRFSHKDDALQWAACVSLSVSGQMAAYMNLDRWLNRSQMENFFFFWLCYKRNGKRCSCATMELWMHLGGLLSIQEARVARGVLLSCLATSQVHP